MIQKYASLCRDLGVETLRGADLSGSDLRYWNLSGSDLRYSNLARANLSYANLAGSDLRYTLLVCVDLRYTNLAGAFLRDATLRGSDLRYSNLTGASLSGADLTGVSLSDSLRVPNLMARVRVAISGPGALDMGAWHHECGTAHCLAGWIVTLAGDEGKLLEQRLGTSAAAACIFTSSVPGERIPDWYATDEDAREEVDRLAAREATTGAQHHGADRGTCELA